MVLDEMAKNDRLNKINQQLRIEIESLRRALARNPTHVFIGHHTSEKYELGANKRKITVK